MPVPLWLHLKLSGLNRPSALPERLPQQASRTGAPVWLRVSEVVDGHDVEEILQVLTERLAAHPLIVTGPPALVERLALPRDCHPFPDPADKSPDIHAALHVWSPAVVLLIGQELPPALISGAQNAGIPVILAAARETRAPYAARLLGMVHTILTEDTAENMRLISRGAHPNRLRVCGRLHLPQAPLSVSASELGAMGDLLQNRPTWFATSVPEDELELVLATQRSALHHAHRLLLLLAPDSREDAVDLARRLADDGWHVARRSLEGEPDQHTQIFIADDPDEYGLWYRLAPVCYMGGSFSGAARNPRNPMEAAALGSAILHGPDTSVFAHAYQSLQAGQASKRLARPEDMADALTELLAPHKAAFLACNAWDVETAGAGAVETLIETLQQAFDAHVDA